MACGLPSWDLLARRLWETTFPNTESPWDDPDSDALAVTTLPQFLPIVFERIFQASPRSFIPALHSALYAEFAPPSKDTIAAGTQSPLVIARLLASRYELGNDSHYWVRPSDRPSVRFLSEFLESRGVFSVEIRSWSDTSFQDLLEDCFGDLSCGPRPTAPEPDPAL